MRKGSGQSVLQVIPSEMSDKVKFYSWKAQKGATSLKRISNILRGVHTMRNNLEVKVK